jgi:hypothetical protein
MGKIMITVREVAEKDLVVLAEYLPRQLPFKNTTKETWVRRFQIWWALNPAFVSHLPRGWVLEKETSLVGFIGNIPVKFLISGEEKTAVAAVTWYVDPSVRGLISIRLLNEFLNQKSVSLFLFNTDNKDLMKILFKNKFKEYILPLFQTEYFYILDKKKLGTIFNEFIFIERFSNVASIWGIVKRSGLLMRAYFYQKPVVRLGALQEKEYVTSLCTSCDDSFLRIWEPVLQNCDITLSRDTKTLNWIYFSSIKPDQRIVIQCRRSQDNSLAGYMVFDIIRKKTSESGVMKLMDMCIEKNDLRVMTSLLQFALETGERDKAALLELWADNPETDAYLKGNFTMRRVFRHYNFIRFSGSAGVNSESLTVCPSLIAPPRGIDHFF